MTEGVTHMAPDTPPAWWAMPVRKTNEVDGDE